MDDLVIGAWKNGLSKKLASEVELVEQKRGKGFRLLPLESTVSALALLLDGYDEVVAEILADAYDGACEPAQQEPATA